MRPKKSNQTTESTADFYNTVQRCMNTIGARKNQDLHVGGTLQSLERLLVIEVLSDELRTDDYICAVMLNDALSHRMPMNSEQEELDESMRPRNYLNHKEHITFYREPFVSDKNIIIFTDQRMIFAKWKNK